MIKIDNINVIVDGSEYSAKVDIPSKVTTSTPQEETVDLVKTPNLFIKVVDPDNTLKIGVNVEVQLTTEEGTYTMICDVVSKNQMYTTLQYSYGMTFEEDDSSDDGSSDDPETETYYIMAGNISHATVTFDDAIGIAEGETETITVTPDSGYVLNTLVVEGDSTGNTINTTDLGNNEYSFVMPAEDVNIHVECILDDDSSDDPDEPTETPAMEISNPSGSPFSMDYNSATEMPEMYMPITVDEMTLGVSDGNVYTTVVDMLGTMGFPLNTIDIIGYLAPTSISGNNHCSLSWDTSGVFYVTSSDNSQWSDDITVEFELNDSNSSYTILGDEWTGNYSSFEEYVATLPESIQPYVTNNAENRPEIPLSVWNGCTANIYFTVNFGGER